MKNRFLFLLAIAAMLFACSEDNLLNDLTKSADETTLNSEMNKRDNGKAVIKPFKIKGSGTISYMPNEICGELVPLLVRGQGNATHLGLFNVELTICSNFHPNIENRVEIIDGTMIAANGDKLFFTANSAVGDIGIDNNGEYTLYHFERGTGRFEFCIGEVKLYGNVEIDPVTLNGIYSNYGEGWIKY